MKAKFILVATIVILICLSAISCSSQGRAEKWKFESSDSTSSSGQSASIESKSSQSQPVELHVPQSQASNKMTLDETLAKRRSIRKFADRPLSQEQLLDLAWAGQGITEPKRKFRTAPSAGALYPVELYLVTTDAVYHYNPHENRLDKHIDGDKRAALCKAALGQNPVAIAAVDIVVAGVVERLSKKYTDRAERYVLIEIGHVAQNILLKAVAMGLGGVPIGAFHDEDVTDILELPKGHYPSYILSIGYPEQAKVADAKPVQSKPRFEDRQDDRDEMVKTQMSGFGRPPVNDKSVLDAMRNVPRHLFIPSYISRNAYNDNPLPIGKGQTISQPYIVAYMTQLLEVEPNDSVLEIGTGSGYQAAILSELTPNVYTIEIIEDLANSAAICLGELGYNTIKVQAGDGYFGWEKYAPFDSIIVTCAAGHIPPPLLKQLKPGGRMIIPIGGQFQAQRLVLASKDDDGDVTTRDYLPVRFVPMTGRAEESQ